ncbi:MAG: molybdopterin-dependent oxidoreductase, partial [Gammaproteobacteria bacterium]|nr:molybdopterin-dependent oxidoreductase [Gammaproteobacteria bacterium]
ISDRDRFSCHGLYADDRVAKPLVKRDQEWFEVSWQEALEVTVQALETAVGDETDAVGVLASPSATVEELFLLKKIASHLRSNSIDYRLRRTDFSDADNDPAWPWLGLDIADIETQQGIVVVGSNLRMEVPIIAHRVRKAALAGARVGFVNPIDYPVRFDREAFVEAPVEDMPRALAGVLVAALESTSGKLPPALADEYGSLEPTAEQRTAAEILRNAESGWLVLGQIVERHPRLTEIRLIAAVLAEATGASLGYLPEGANAAGAAMLGFTPKRGEAKGGRGLDAEAMLSAPRHAYILHGVEPNADLADSELAAAALKSADVVVALTSFADDDLLECCDIVLPIAGFSETPGTFVNAEGRWQSFDAAAKPFGDSRPAWRVLRVLAEQLGVDDCSYPSIDVIQAELAETEWPAGDNTYEGSPELRFGPVDVDYDALDVPIYSIDALVRRSEPLQQTQIALARSEAAPAARRTA